MLVLEAVADELLGRGEAAAAWWLQLVLVLLMLMGVCRALRALVTG